jgi:AraC-like DNA-binding protein
MGVIDASSHKATITHSRLIDHVVESLREKPERKVSLDDLAREAGMSPSLFISRFKQLTGLPPVHFQLACRLEKAKRLLAETDMPITQLALDLGFCASQHFSGHFKRAFGLTPSAWRKRAAARRGGGFRS